MLQLEEEKHTGPKWFLYNAAVNEKMVFKLVPAKDGVHTHMYENVDSLALGCFCDADISKVSFCSHCIPICI